MGGESGFESILVRMTGGAVGVVVVSSIAAIGVPVVSLGVAHLTDTGGRVVDSIGKAAFWIKELNLAGPAAGGINTLANELAIEEAKSIGLSAIWRLGAGCGVDVSGVDGALDHDLCRGGRDHGEGVEGLGFVVDQNETAAWVAGTLVAPQILRPEA